MDQDSGPLNCELSQAEGELLLVLQSALSEWGADALIVQLPQDWISRPIELGVEVQYATIDTIAVIVDCGDHYIQYHAELNEIFQQGHSLNVVFADLDADGAEELSDAAVTYIDKENGKERIDLYDPPTRLTR